MSRRATVKKKLSALITADLDRGCHYYRRFVSLFLVTLMARVLQ
jgi:hypothetical protein